jgi:hypothetical protein|eukprot:6436277-Prymnesium_polylepis.3
MPATGRGGWLTGKHGKHTNAVIRVSRRTCWSLRISIMCHGCDALAPMLRGAEAVARALLSAGVRKAACMHA